MEGLNESLAGASQIQWVGTFGEMTTGNHRCCQAMRARYHARRSDEEEGNEGQVLSRVHRYRERDRKLVARKKEKFLQEHPRLVCQACGFNFQVQYGERGKDYIECHHTKPVSELSVGETTKLSDLILLCSNCHRIVHRRKPWLSIDELKQLIRNHGN